MSIALQATRARGQLAQLPVPSRRDENYRFLSFEGVAWSDLAKSDRHPNSRRNKSATPSLPREIGYCGSWDDAPESVREKFTDFLDSQAELSQPLSEDYFAQLALSREESPFLVLIRENQTLDTPVVLSRRSDHGRLLIRLDQGAQATVMEEFGCAESPHESVWLTQIVLDARSTLRWSRVQNVDLGQIHFHRLSVSAREGAVAHLSSIDLGARLGQLRAALACDGRESEIHWKGCTVRGGESQMDTWVTCHHRVPGTKSSTEQWSLARGRAKINFNGRLIIEREATGTDAWQRNRNLLLSSQAVIDSSPKLEINTDDVKCSHGASISNIDEEQLYYLESRGIDRAEAEHLIITGFIEPVISTLPQGEYREQISNQAAGVS